MGDKNEIEVSASESTVSLKVQGDGVDRLTMSLADLIGPFSEMAGAVADKVRLYRERNALRGLAEARAIAAELNLQVKPVRPKFLLRWMESVSLEEGHDGELQKLWAGLLVAESSHSSPAHPLFCRILEDMTPRHAQLLLYLADIPDVDSRDVRFSDADPTAKLRAWTTGSFYKEFQGDIHGQEILSQLINQENQFFKINKFELKRKKPEVEDNKFFYWSENKIFEFEKDHTLRMLQMNGILESTSIYISIESTNTDRENSITGFANGIYITSLGRDFLAACMGKPRK